MRYEGKCFCSDRFVGTVKADTFKELKRQASKTCNGYYHVIDTLILYKSEDEEIEDLKFIRVNQVTPNGNILRGRWR